MTHKQEVAIAHAMQSLHDTGAVFIIAYGFPGDIETYVEGRGDSSMEHRTHFTHAILNHWSAGQQIDTKPNQK